MTRTAIAGMLGLVVWSSAVADAQSLGDVARQEAERRKTVATAGKVYTNQTLRPEAPPSSPARPRPAAPEAVPPAAGPEGGATEQAAATPQAEVRDEKYWRDRMSGQRELLARSRTFAEALESRVNALSTDFVNRDDPAQRAVIDTDRQRAAAELARVRQEVIQHEKSIAGIQDEARRAGAPAGWVR